MGEILLIRHCASTGQEPAAPLSEAGLEAARQLAGRLDGLGVDALYSSPFARALGTIEPFAKRRGLDVGREDRLRERLLSPSPIDDWMDQIRRSFADLDHRVPGGESLRDARTRGLAALAEIASRDHGRAAAVSHGNLISSVLMSVDPSFGVDDWGALHNPHLFLLQMDGGRLVGYRSLER